jgi:hypothetical protein
MQGGNGFPSDGSVGHGIHSFVIKASTYGRTTAVA